MITLFLSHLHKRVSRNWSFLFLSLIRWLLFRASLISWRATSWSVTWRGLPHLRRRFGLVLRFTGDSWVGVPIVNFAFLGLLLWFRFWRFILLTACSRIWTWTRLIVLLLYILNVNRFNRLIDFIFAFYLLQDRSFQRLGSSCRVARFHYYALVYLRVFALSLGLRGVFFVWAWAHITNS